MNEQHFKGSLLITKLLLKQYRFQIFSWILSIGGISLITAYSYPNVYPDDASKQAFAITMENPAMVAMLGPGYHPADYLLTIGAQFAQEMLLFTVIAVAIMNILLMGNSTRADEEVGRIEVVRSLPVGRLSYLIASFLMIFIVNGLLFLLISFGLYFLNIDDGITLESSILYGSILASSGLLFAVITSTLAQVFDSSKNTTSFAFAVLIFSYIIRAIGDVNSDFLSYFSPLGWIVRTKVFVHNDWWPILVTFIAIIIIGIIAFYLNLKRDMNAGYVHTKKGKTYATPLLKTSLGFIFQLQRMKMLAWIIGVFSFGAAFGAVLEDMETFYKDFDIVQKVFSRTDGFSFIEQYITFLFSIMAIINSIPIVMTILKLKSEEIHNRTEHIFSRVMSRNKVLSNYLSLAIIESILLQFVGAFGLWIVSISMLEHPLEFHTTIMSAFVYLPAMWFIISFTVLLYGVIPKFTSMIWLYVTYCFVVLYAGGLIGIPNWMMNLSIFEITPKYPGEDLEFLPLMIIVLLSIIATIIGYMGYNKRDING